MHQDWCYCYFFIFESNTNSPICSVLCQGMVWKKNSLRLKSRLKIKQDNFKWTHNRKIWKRCLLLEAMYIFTGILHHPCFLEWCDDGHDHVVGMILISIQTAYRIQTDILRCLQLYFCSSSLAWVVCIICRYFILWFDCWEASCII